MLADRTTVVSNRNAFTVRISSSEVGEMDGD